MLLTYHLAGRYLEKQNICISSYFLLIVLECYIHTIWTHIISRTQRQFYINSHRLSGDTWATKHTGTADTFCIIFRTRSQLAKHPVVYDILQDKGRYTTETKTSLYLHAAYLLCYICTIQFRIISFTQHLDANFVFNILYIMLYFYKF